MLSKEYNDRKCYAAYDKFSHFTSLDEIETFRQIKEWSKGKILDVGCGIGYLTHYLEAIGVDINSYAIEQAKKLYPAQKFYCIDAASMTFSEKFDTIVCHNILEHVNEKTREKIFDRIEKHLAPNGVVIFGYLNPYNFAHMFFNLWGRAGARRRLLNKTHHFNGTFKQFKEIINERFEILEEKNTGLFSRWLWINKYIKGNLILKTVPNSTK